ncbi:MAG TPA: ABC transporter permease subunit [Longimicrobiales bacterium]
MISDVQPVIWKEWRELLRMSGTGRAALGRHIFSVGIIGVIWPWQFGLPFVHSGLAVALAAVTALMYIAGAAPDAFAGERERHTLETLLASRVPDQAILLGKIIALVEYGCLAAVIMLIIGLITVNVVHGHGQFLMFSPTQLISMLVFTPLAAGLMASIGVHVSLRAKTVKQAQQMLSTAVLIVLFLPAIAFPYVPDNWRSGVVRMLQSEERAYIAGGLAVAMLLLQALLFALAAVRFKRGRLIL